MAERNRTFHADAGHGWIEVERAEVVALGIHVSSFSYQKGTKVYLEEDCDASHYVLAVQKAGDTVTMVMVDDGNNSPIRNYDRFEA